jgi:DNA-binding SARP family transcriptional activator/tetratricopeptide (TPR) repeat protein
MEFGVLGSLQVNGRDLGLQPKPRVVLAALLLHANRVVSVDTLVEALWDDAPPRSARVTLQGYVKQLRRGVSAQVGERVVTQSLGYLVRVAADELDLTRFTALCGRARAATAGGDWRGAAALCVQALELWRGEPLADVSSAWLQRTQAPRLAELRMQAVELRIEADGRLGQHGQLVAELRQLTSTEPLREGLHGQLMLALYRSGRQAEALGVFRGIDRRLREELGVAAGSELQGLHQRMLAGDQSLMASPVPVAGARLQRAPAMPAGGPGRRVVPRQVPPDTVDFTGREEQVKLLCDLLAAPPDPGRPGAVVISAVTGMGGIGKTALAVHVAHRLRERFPDGQLYVSLQGATSPLPPAEVLARLLRDLGDPDGVIPSGEAERVGRYRSLLAGRKVLVVLDDARDAAQVRSLLPGSASCALIVTSRAALPDLAGAAQLGLDVLGEREARELFGAIVGTERAAAEPQAVAAVLECCAGLPLAVRIAASRLLTRPGWSIGYLAAKLAGERGRLAELAAGDLAVRASFEISYQALPAGQPPRRGTAGFTDPAWLFRLLGLADAAVLSVGAIAALAGRPPARPADDPPAELTAALEILTDAHLLASPAPGQFRLHDLLRSYAAELARHTDSQPARSTAISRMLRWYGEQAVRAALALFARLPASDLFPAAGPPAMAGPAQAIDWYESELDALRAAVAQAAGLGLHDIVARIAAAMWAFFTRTPHLDDWIAITEAGVASARELGDDAVLSWLLNSLGQTHAHVRQSAQAPACLTEALEIRRRTGDRTGEAIVLNSLGMVASHQGRFEEALGYAQSALAIHNQISEPRNVAVCLANIGDTLLHLHRQDEALDHLVPALVILQKIGDKHAEGIAENTIADTYLALGRPEESLQYYRRARAALQDSSRDGPDIAEALYGMGAALASLGRDAEACQAWRAALPIFEQLGDPRALEIRDKLVSSVSQNGQIEGVTRSSIRT